MKVKCIQYIEAELSLSERLRVTEETLKFLCNWPNNADITVDGKLVRVVKYTTSHSWSEMETIRDANDNDIALSKMLNLIRIKGLNSRS